MRGFVVATKTVQFMRVPSFLCTRSPVGCHRFCDEVHLKPTGARLYSTSIDWSFASMLLGLKLNTTNIAFLFLCVVKCAIWGISNV